MATRRYRKAKGLPISFLCDRNKVDIPSSQIGFIKGFVLSSFECLVAIFPNLKYTVEYADNNIKRWKKLQDEKRLKGWTPKKEKKEDKGKKDENEENENLEIKMNEEKKEETIKEENKNEVLKQEENNNNEIKNEQIKNEQIKNEDDE